MSFLGDTYHTDPNCSALKNKKTKEFIIPTDVAQRMEKIKYLDDNEFTPCKECDAPSIKEMNNIDKQSFTYDSDTHTIFKLADDEIYIIPIDEKTIKSSKLKTAGERSELFVVARSYDPSLQECRVMCEIERIRKSNLSGAEGELVIRPLYVTKKDGTRVKLCHDDIYIRGLNRTNVKLWCSFIFPPMLFIAGSGAKVKPGTGYIVTLK